MKAWFNQKLGRYQVVRPDGSMTFRYRHMMEVHLGRRLDRDEHVHHINGDPTDDRLDNLRIVSPAEHGALHADDTREGIHRKWQYEWSSKHACCVVCGGTDRKHSAKGMCSYCYFQNRERTVRGRAPRVPREFVTRRCEECGVDFTTPKSRKHQRLCSPTCRAVVANNARWADHRSERQA